MSALAGACHDLGCGGGVTGPEPLPSSPRAGKPSVTVGSCVDLRRMVQQNGQMGQDRCVAAAIQDQDSCEYPGTPGGGSGVVPDAWVPCPVVITPPSYGAP